MSMRFWKAFHTAAAHVGRRHFSSFASFSSSSCHTLPYRPRDSPSASVRGTTGSTPVRASFRREAQQVFRKSIHTLHGPRALVVI